MFSVGQKVVLVDDEWPQTVVELYSQLPVKDTTYVVRSTAAGVQIDALLMDSRRVLTQSLLLVGIVNQLAPKGSELGFSSTRFRALEELQETNHDTVSKVEEARA
jgi:hypothetical protein